MCVELTCEVETTSWHPEGIGRVWNFFEWRQRGNGQEGWTGEWRLCPAKLKLPVVADQTASVFFLLWFFCGWMVQFLANIFAITHSLVTSVDGLTHSHSGGLMPLWLAGPLETLSGCCSLSSEFDFCIFRCWIKPVKSLRFNLPYRNLSSGFRSLLNCTAVITGVPRDLAGPL